MRSQDVTCADFSTWDVGLDPRCVLRAWPVYGVRGWSASLGSTAVLFQHHQPWKSLTTTQGKPFLHLSAAYGTGNNKAFKYRLALANNYSPSGFRTLYNQIRQSSRTIVNMISDGDLYTLAVFLGSVSMVLIVLYHYFEVNASDKVQEAPQQGASEKKATGGS